MADDATIETAGSTPAAPAAPAPTMTPSAVLAIQLTQVRVPLDEAAEALSTADAAGRLPIVVLPEHALRIRNELVIAGVVVLVVGVLLDLSLPLRGSALAI